MPKVLLGDVAFERKETCKNADHGYPIVGLEHLDSKGICLQRWAKQTDNTFTKVFHKGDILFGRRRAYLKKAAVAPFDGICSGDITVIEANSKCILPELLPFVIQNDSLFDFAISKSAGSLSPRVKWEHLKTYEFWLLDIDKQKELAELLWLMEKTRQSYQKLIAKTDELIKSRFIEMSKQWGSDTTEGPLEDFLSEITYGFTNPMPDTDEGPWKITAKDVTNEGINFQTARKTKKEDFDLLTAKSKPIMDDILVTKDGSLGRIALVNQDNICINQSVALLRCNQKVLPKFLASLLKMDDYQNKMLADAGGVTIKHIYITRLAKMVVEIPSLENQSKWLEFLQQVDKSKLALQESLEKLEILQKSIIKKYLG